MLGRATPVFIVALMSALAVGTSSSDMCSLSTTTLVRGPFRSIFVFAPDSEHTNGALLGARSASGANLVQATVSKAGSGTTNSQSNPFTTASFTADGLATVTLDTAAQMQLMYNRGAVYSYRLGTPQVILDAGAVGSYGNANGVRNGIRFGGPHVEFMRPRNGYVIFIDTLNHCLRGTMLVEMTTTTYAGNCGVPGSADGTSQLATFDRPRAPWYREASVVWWLVDANGLRQLTGTQVATIARFNATALGIEWTAATTTADTIVVASRCALHHVNTETQTIDGVMEVAGCKVRGLGVTTDNVVYFISLSDAGAISTTFVGFNAECTALNTPLPLPVTPEPTPAPTLIPPQPEDDSSSPIVIIAVVVVVVVVLIAIGVACYVINIRKVATKKHRRQEAYEMANVDRHDSQANLTPGTRSLGESVTNERPLPINTMRSASSGHQTHHSSSSIRVVSDHSTPKSRSTATPMATEVTPRGGGFRDADDGRKDLDSAMKVKVLGRGAFGTVFSCVLEDGSVIAMKEILVALDDRHADSIRREVDIVSKMRHPNIIHHYGTRYNSAEHKLLLFMELATGGSLSAACRSAGQRIPENVVKRYMRQLLEALSYLHSRGVVHRDVKCDNLLLDQDGTVKLGDFGTSRLMERDASGRTFAAQTMTGTPHFMAPEFFADIDSTETDNGGSEVSGHTTKADIWSFGITVLELADEGRMPWPSFGNQAAALLYISGPKGKPTIPSFIQGDFRDFVESCVQRNPSLRPSAQDLLQHRWLQ